MLLAVQEMRGTVYVSRGRRRRRFFAAAVAVVAVGLASVKVVDAVTSVASSDSVGVGSGSGGAGGWPSVDWPADGAAAVAVGGGTIHVSGSRRAVPIASLAKVMTALVVLRHHPVSSPDDGFTMRITPYDVDDTARRRSQGQSVVAVAAGEELTEWQALQALLLPSANNMAIALARAVSGSIDAFVDDMNGEARRLGMTSTRYTDPSGFDAGTVSTPRDQVVLARAAMRLDAFAAIVGERAAELPVAGVVTNTDTLLGRDGFIGIKTGSDAAAGGCFMFAARDGDHRLVYGVVLGQRGGPLIAAGLKAARRLVDSVRAVLP